MTYFYAPISTIVSGALQPPIISLNRSVTTIIRPTLYPPLRASETTYNLQLASCPVVGVCNAHFNTL